MIGPALVQSMVEVQALSEKVIDYSATVVEYACL